MSSDVLETVQTSELAKIDFGLDILRENIEAEVAADKALTVADKETRKVANERRLVWVKRRTTLDKARKRLGEEARRRIELINQTAKEFQSLFDPAEEHLREQIEAYDAAIAKAEQDKLDAAWRAKHERLMAAGLDLPRVYVESLSDADIDAKIREAEETRRLREAEEARLAAEKAEAERRTKEQAEAIRKEAERIAAERAELEREKAELERLRHLLQSEQEAEARPKLEEEQVRQAKPEANRLASEATDAALLKSELLKPDREKLMQFADTIGRMSGQVPECSEASKTLCRLVGEVIEDCAAQIRVYVNDWIPLGRE